MTILDNHLLTYVTLQLTTVDIENRLDSAILRINDADVHGGVGELLDILKLVPDIGTTVSRNGSNGHIERAC